MNRIFGSTRFFPEFDDFETGDMAIVKGEAEKGAHFLPSVVTGRPRIDMQHTKLMVGYDFQYVGVSANHQIDAVFGEDAFHSGCIFPGIAPDVGHPDPDTLNFKTFHLFTAAAHVAVVDIATHGPYDRGYSFKPTDNVDVADIACVPYLIAILKVDCIAVVPA